MSRRSRQKKIQPAETVLNYIIPDGVSYLDVNRDLSLLNRRAYRQGQEIYLTVEVFGDNSSNAAELSIFRAPRTWVVANAWTMAFHQWKDQQDDTIDESAARGTRGKHNDFKIYLDGDMKSSPLVLPSNVPVPSMALAIDPDSKGDWDYSQFVIPNDGGVSGNTQEYYGHLLGPDIADSKGLVHAYAEARSRPHPSDPAVVDVVGPSSGGLYEEMEDVGEESGEILDNVRYENNAAPYPVGTTTFEFYPGGEQTLSAIPSGWDIGADNWLVCEDTLIVRAGSTISTDATKPFGVLCGLLRLNNSGDEILQVKIRVMSGPVKGLAALPLQDVN